MRFFDLQMESGVPSSSEREYGVVTGIVKENWEKEHPGMVKVQYFLGEEGKNVTGWVPVVSGYAGKGYGGYALPEVGDAVVIAFVRGDRNCPIVLGSFWTKVNNLPPQTAVEKNTVKRFLTKGGCQIEFDDTENKNKIEISTPKKMKISIEDENEVITISDEGGKNGIVLDCKGGSLKVCADKKMELCVGGNPMVTLDGSAKSIQLKGTKVDINADQAINAKGSNTQISGSMVSIKGDSTTKVESSGMLQVKGSMVKIN